MLRQYEDLKAAHPGTLMLFRCGDFYETYGTDAEEAGRLLNIVVTKKASGADGNVAMAGVPYHAIESYIAKLVRAGRRVAIAEQTEDPKQAKGLVKREVLRIVTPGTVLSDSSVEEKQNSYIAALFRDDHGFWGLAIADLTTGFFGLTEQQGEAASEELLQELLRAEPREILLPEGLDAGRLRPLLIERAVAVTRLPPTDFRLENARRLLCDHFRVQSLEGFGAHELELGTIAAGALLRYLKETQKSGSVAHLHSLTVRQLRRGMVLDDVTQRSLEIVRNSQGSRETTLLSVLDRTETPMGARLLRGWLLEPLREQLEIEARLGAVEDFVQARSLRGALAEALRGVRDVERIVARAAVGAAGPKELAVLRAGLAKLPAIRAILLGAQAPLLRDLGTRLDLLEDLAALLAAGLADDPPVLARDGGAIREGFRPALDELLRASRGGKEFIAALRAQEAARLGIPALKISYNRVFGYYIELTTAQVRQLSGGVPADYIRKQTLANAERYITPELKEKEELVLHAEERLSALEAEIFAELRQAVADRAPRLLGAAAILAEADALLSLAQVALSQGYVRPRLNRDGKLHIRDGRHPVLESIQRDPPFVPNDAILESSDCQIGLITGPNMGGKSTFIRQVALIVLMAHVGSFVPASDAEIPLRDRIFTRVGAMDHLARGQSTFLVEMTELANILRHATDDSLVILDEIGRGTSTYDGLSIAWSVCEYIHNTDGRRPLTLFATHYHELTDLAGALPRLRNLSVAVREDAGALVFLYRIVAGHTDRSYGIHAAKIAGVPELAVRRAQEILAGLEDGRAVAPRVAANSPAPKTKKSARMLPTQEPWESLQLSLFDNAAPHPAVERLRAIQPDRLTPIMALTVLAELVNDAKKE